MDGQEYFIMKEDEVLAVIDSRPQQTASGTQGVATETEMKENKARVEDAMHATKAAVEEGIVPAAASHCSARPRRSQR